ncbi:MAG: hypothetical protein QOI03_620 [Solirubrobacteraceae bacterium]|jgi:hypothetical protein|nr:hypothetical protein [Solirubrobacteraceae bacterium]
MSPPEQPPRAEPDDGLEQPPVRGGPPTPTPHYGRYVGLLAIVILALITINTITTSPNGATGVAPGSRLPPFAVPLVGGSLSGDANIATRAHEGSAGSLPACEVRGAQILNVCQLYEQGPLVLTLIVDGGSCPGILSDMQRLTASFPEVRFAAVAIKAGRTQLRRLLRSRGLTLPVGIDRDGVLVALYKDASCPQVTFAYPGGIAQGRALLNRPPFATLRARVSALLAGARARGWSPPRG